MAKKIDKTEERIVAVEEAFSKTEQFIERNQKIILIVVGAMILEKARSGEMDQALLQGWLDRALSRAADRALFDLAPLEAGTISSDNV